MLNVTTKVGLTPDLLLQTVLLWKVKAAQRGTVNAQANRSAAETLWET